MLRRWTVPVALALLACFTGGWLLQSRLRQSEVYRQARLFEEVLDRVRDYQIDSVPESELYRKASDGLLRELHDPYAALLIGKDWAALQERTSGDYAGVGLLVDARNGWITVVTPLPDSPADRAGIRAGDQLMAVDGWSAAGWSMERAVRAMRGEPGTRVDMVFRREGSPTVSVRLNRERVHQRAVPPGMMLEHGVGYLSLTIVREHCAAELEEEIARMVGQGMTSLVLDLRSNTGGVRDEAVQAADLFLDPGQEILASRGRAPGDNHHWTDHTRQRWPGLSIVVLANRGTASAAEIIAGALQDHDRALVVGDTTYGKGIVQSVFALAPDTALRITTARWYTPSGRSIQAASLDSAMGTRHAPSPASAFRSDRGRVLYADGGIAPDVALAVDTLSAAEQSFARALEGRAAVFRDALTGYALQAKAAGTIRSEQFRIEGRMRGEVVERMRRQGVVLPDSLVQGADRLIDQQLGYEIARYLFGLTAERRRRLGDDDQVREAVALLRATGSPEALIGMAGRHPADH